MFNANNFEDKVLAESEKISSYSAQVSQWFYNKPCIVYNIFNLFEFSSLIFIVAASNQTIITARLHFKFEDNLKNWTQIFDTALDKSRMSGKV